MNIIVIGAGFTGIITAISVKKNCPNAIVSIVHDKNQPINAGFGESGPLSFIGWLMNKFKVPEAEKDKWATDYILGIKGVPKYSVHYKDFVHKHDNGVLINISAGTKPDHQLMFNTQFGNHHIPQSILQPTSDRYNMVDIWNELYIKGQRVIEDVGPDMNPYYWFNAHNKIALNRDPHSSMQLNSDVAAAWIKDNLGDVIDHWIDGNIRSVMRSEDGSIKNLILEDNSIVEGDFFIDCSGFKRIIGRRCNLDWSPAPEGIRHNTALVTANGYRCIEDIQKQANTFTGITAQDYGWMFTIPLMNKRSYGYVFNSDTISADKLMEELDEVSNIKSRTVDPFLVKWEPGAYKKPAQLNFALVGLSSGFIDPFDAATIYAQTGQIDRVIDFINSNNSIVSIMDDYNSFTRRTLESVFDRIDISFGLAPRDNNEYWLHNHEVARKNKSLEKLFAEINNPLHSSDAKANSSFIIWPQHVYHITGLYYGIDMQSRCRDTDSKALMLASAYIESHMKLNKLRAEISPTVVEWLSMHNINIEELLTPEPFL